MQGTLEELWQNRRMISKAKLNSDDLSRMFGKTQNVGVGFTSFLPLNCYLISMTKKLHVTQ